ncbi:fatty acid hydroxylase [Methyloglobulus morosus KoM1]|uniref:Fatty acid hydroxylase n=1 Tax=Methyloglobulus morosus KoM1 TaxID=1116472 RepID=V5C598_9GAMM|nr:sterol desaturase family protein [Methyloglobulus morosus]ESS73647.1 fatty acid hydroxylase [Methyloglobulus morosus KoM1]
MQNETANFPISLILFGLAMLVFIALVVMEKLKPYRRFPDEIEKESLLTNTTTFLFNNIILTALRVTSLYFVAQQFSSHGLLSDMGNHPVKWILSFLLYDLSIYAWHVANHKYSFLWRFHKVHHSDRSINVSTGFRFHVFDLFLEILYRCVFVILVGVDAYLVMVMESIQLFFIFFHHSNLSFKNEKWLSKFIITPYLHRTHHSTLRIEHDSNYGIVLAFWDKLFDTRKELVPENIGLDIIEAENCWQLFFLAFITEDHIRKLWRMIPKGRKP